MRTCFIGSIGDFRGCSGFGSVIGVCHPVPLGARQLVSSATVRLSDQERLLLFPLSRARVRLTWLAVPVMIALYLSLVCRGIDHCDRRCRTFCDGTGDPATSGCTQARPVARIQKSERSRPQPQLHAPGSWLRDCPFMSRESRAGPNAGRNGPGVGASGPYSSAVGRG